MGYVPSGNNEPTDTLKFRASLDGLCMDADFPEIKSACELADYMELLQSYGATNRLIEKFRGKIAYYRTHNIEKRFQVDNVQGELDWQIKKRWVMESVLLSKLNELKHLKMKYVAWTRSDS